MEEIIRLELGNGQSVGVSFNYDTSTTHMDFYDENYRSYYTSQLILSQGDTRCFLNEVSQLNTTFMKILAGEWELVERRDITDTLRVKILADEIPKIKVMVKNRFFRWSKFEVKYFEWAKLANGLLPILKNLCEELDSFGYEVPNTQRSQEKHDYRWKMVKMAPPNSMYRTESYSGPWQKNIREVVNNCKEFMKRSCDHDRSTMIIEMMVSESEIVKSLGPMNIQQMRCENV